VDAKAKNMRVKNISKFQEKFSKRLLKHFFLKMSTHIFLAFSKVDFYVIVRNKKAQASNSGFWNIEKTKFSMKDMDFLIVSFLDFAHNKKSARKLNV
jgi:hypothetical protein